MTETSKFRFESKRASLPTFEVWVRTHAREELLGMIYSTDRQVRDQNPGKWAIHGHPGRYDSMLEAAEALSKFLGWCE